MANFLINLPEKTDDFMQYFAGVRKSNKKNEVEKVLIDFVEKMLSIEEVKNSYEISKKHLNNE